MANVVHHFFSSPSVERSRRKKSCYVKNSEETTHNPLAYTSPSRDSYTAPPSPQTLPQILLSWVSWVAGTFQTLIQPSIQAAAMINRYFIDDVDNNINEHVEPRPWQIMAASIALVSIPVFFQAPLVRTWPWVSLLLTLGWFGGAIALMRRQSTRQWGDLLLGFTWTWLAGSVYWGWLRWEPFLHLPVEAIGLPFALWGLRHQQHKIGHWFYIGSLFGTTITDIYFYLVNLIPYWRQVMQVSPNEAQLILHQALLPMKTLWGYGCAATLVSILLIAGYIPLQSKQLHWRAFSGAVLSTLLVDGLFWVAAAVY